MSAETKQNAEDASSNLKRAEQYVKIAEKYASGTGDKSLSTKITKIKETVQQTHQEIDHKLSEGR